MSIIDSIVSTVSNVVSTAASAASSIASVAFPQLALASSAMNLISQCVGSAVNQAAQQLTQECGMPKFLADIVGKVVKDVLQDLCKPPADHNCHQACQDKIGGQLRDFAQELGKSIATATRQFMDCGDEENGGVKGGKGGGNWLVAMAKAMGKVAGEHAKKLADLSDQINSLQGGNGDQAQQASQLQSQMQAEGQMFGMLQSAFSNVLKSIGEGMSTMARKG